MMPKSAVKPPMLAGNAGLIFGWRLPRNPFLPKVVAVLFAVSAFALLLAFVRVRFTVQDKASPRKAEMIYLRNDEQGRSLALRASEGGPFPSRFEPSNWGDLAKIEADAMDAARYQPPPYTPAMRDLPADSLVRPLELAAKGLPFFPKRNRDAVIPPTPTNLKPSPVLYAFSGISPADLPTSLPRFQENVDAAMSSASWRFLLRLNPWGGVMECVSLEKGGEPGAAKLETWLKQISFKPEQGKSSRWISIGIGFTNQPVHGPDAR